MEENDDAFHEPEDGTTLWELLKAWRPCLPLSERFMPPWAHKISRPAQPAPTLPSRVLDRDLLSDLARFDLGPYVPQTALLDANENLNFNASAKKKAIRLDESKELATPAPLEWLISQFSRIHSVAERAAMNRPSAIALDCRPNSSTSSTKSGAALAAAEGSSCGVAV